MLKMIEQSGPMMALIILIGAAAMVVFLERFFHVHRAKIKTDDFLKGIRNIMRRGNVAEAVTICEETPGPVPSIVRAAILQQEQDRTQVPQAIERAALTEISRIERHLGALATIAQIAPLLGILGTILGMIRIYFIIEQQSPLVTISDMLGGLWSALLTSAAGLIVAVFSYIGYNFLVTKVNAITLDMEQAAGEMMTLLLSLPTPNQAISRHAGSPR